ncbi:putative Ig domain-containing protein, partial [Neoroseomonas rubea]|uniref:putative Ig domain-containing protein n=1 Tax=Neoroseomonas rubea TaxID=2748666 RepID=UPI0018DFE823
PAGAFADPDTGDSLAYTATLADGSPLPAWLSFDPATRTFSGTPGNADVGTVSIRITVADSAGATIADCFDITVAAAAPANTAPNDIVLSTTSANERIAPGGVIATLITTDADLGDTHAYSIVSDPDQMFEIRDNTLALRSNTAFDREEQISHSVTIRSTDPAGASVDRVVTIQIIDFADTQRTGTDASQTISSAGGNEDMHGRGGGDTVNGAHGADRLWGEDGDDRLFGNNANDQIWGGEGRDTIQGGPGTDYGFGGTGNDSLFGDSDNDSLWGEGGTDTIDGAHGNDHIWGGDDADLIRGNTQDDRLYGEAGDDTIDAGTDQDIVWGGQGNDSILGADGNDSLRGDDGDDILLGGRNDDQITGGSGNDSLMGEDGADTLVGGTGADTLQGGAGNDVYIASDDGTSDVLFGGVGTDTISLVEVGAYRGGSWTLELTSGSIVNESANVLALSADADGRIIFADNSQITFQDIERLTWQ